MPIRLILLGLIANGADKHQALKLLQSQGLHRGEALTIIHEYGIDFPISSLPGDLNPSHQRRIELQEISLTL